MWKRRPKTEAGRDIKCDMCPGKRRRVAKYVLDDFPQDSYWVCEKCLVEFYEKLGKLLEEK